MPKKYISEEQARQHILDTSHDLFMSSGIKKITTEMLAKECGVSKKTIYRFFNSKNEIVDTIADNLIGRLKEEFARIDKSDEDPLEKIYKLFEFPFTIFKDISTVLLEDLQHYYPEIEDRFNTFRQEHNMVFIETFKKGKESGVFKDIHPSFVLSFFRGAGNNVLNSDFVLNNDISLEETISSFKELMLSGLLQTNKN
ncbi:MAG: TetR/AcrR family transcriptional regulator [bacterium]|nr:TetR/AcrR family transcriptional regulator [bacterium]